MASSVTGVIDSPSMTMNASAMAVLRLTFLAAKQSPPIDQTWGTREIVVRDADRNVINFGQHIAGHTPS